MSAQRQHAEQQTADKAEADLPVWDLSDLYQAMDDPAIERDLKAADDGADGLIKDGQGRLAQMDGADLAAFIARYEKIEDGLGRVYSYASLLHAAKSDDAEISRFYQTVRERINDIGTKLLFVTLEINKIEDANLEAKVDGDAGLARYRPWLRDVRSFRPYQLDDEIERVLHEKSITGRAAWNRLFDETMARIRFPLDGKDLTSAEIFDILSDKDRAKTRGGGQGHLGDAFGPGQPLCADHQHARQGQADRRRLAQIPAADFVQKSRQSGRGRGGRCPDLGHQGRLSAPGT